MFLEKRFYVKIDTRVKEMENESQIGNDFWKRVFLILDEQKMTQTELARRAGITPQTISVARQKGSIPSVYKGDRIAKALGVPLDYLLYGESDKDVDPIFLSAVNTLKENELANGIIRDMTKLNYDDLNFLRKFVDYIAKKMLKGPSLPAAE